MATDTHTAETERVYAELAEARDAFLADRDDPFAKVRHDRAQEAVRENRRVWREIGEALGSRSTFVSTADHETSAPTLIAQEA